MSLLNLNLETFLVVYESITISGAAKKMGVGQTAVTERIKALENQLGATLFTRSRKGTVLTSEGKSLLKYCLRVREMTGEVLSEIREGGLENDVEIRIAGPTSFVSGRAVPQCEAVYKNWPRVNLQFTIDDRENRIDLLKQGLADIVILHPHQVPLETSSKLLKPDEYYLVGHPSWGTRDLKDILETERLFAFHPEDPSSLNYLRSYDLLKFLKRPRLYANENLALSTLLKQGVGFGILSKEISQQFISEKTLVKLNEGRSMKDPLAAAWFPRAKMPPYFKEIIRSLK